MLHNQSQPGQTNGAFLRVPMFIPYELELEGRPELRKFPANVLFAKVTTIDGVNVMGSALYEPDVSSFARDGTRHLLSYKNTHGGNCWLQIAYDTEKQAWKGDKIIDGKIVGCAFGNSWQRFFTQFTLLGLKNGERCVMEKLASPPTVTR